MYYSHRNPGLIRESINRLRPTQLTVGLAEVSLKKSEWAALGKRERKVQLQHHVFPAVLGPGKRYYIVDHHHLGLALMGQGIEEVWITVLDDMSWLDLAVFWRTMEFRAWSHPYDNRGNRRDYADMPQRLTELQDDPYRSLAGLVRNAGGFAKNEAPFVEFLWADFFRPLIESSLIKKNPKRATKEGVRLASTARARYLPGWTGKADL